MTKPNSQPSDQFYRLMSIGVPSESQSSIALGNNDLVGFLCSEPRREILPSPHPNQQFRDHGASMYVLIREC